MRVWWLLPMMACTGSTATDGAPGDDPTDATDGDTGPTGDSGATEPEDPQLRAIHVAATVPGQDMFGNGNAGQPPLVDLLFGEAWPSGRPSATRPADTITFTFVDDGAAKPWTTFDYTLEEGSFTTLVVVGTTDDRSVLAIDDPITDLPDDRVRLQWTHAAPTYADATVVLQDALGRDPYNGGTGIAYGQSAAFDEALGAMNVWIDLDGNEACDPGEAFEAFEREAGDYFHVIVTEDGDGALFLQGYTLSGQIPTRLLAKECP